jgi:hypothetical protein
MRASMSNGGGPRSGDAREAVMRPANYKVDLLG